MYSYIAGKCIILLYCAKGDAQAGVTEELEKLISRETKRINTTGEMNYHKQVHCNESEAPENHVRNSTQHCLMLNYVATSFSVKLKNKAYKSTINTTCTV